MGFLRERIKHFLLDRGVLLSHPPGQFSIVDLKLRAMAQRGVAFETILDGGAADGQWTQAVKLIFPDARVLMVEPREAAQDALKQVAGSCSNVVVAQVMLGAAQRKVSFNELGHQSSMLNDPHGERFGTVKQAQMTSIDELLAGFEWESVDLIKLDLQGYELEALSGAKKALKSTQAVLLEVSFLPIFQGVPLAGDVMEFMKDHGFQLYDIAGLWHRPLDGALAQGDFIFIRRDHPVVRDGSWGHNGFA